MPTEPLYDVSVQHHVTIPARDGLALSANLWLPVPRRPEERFPAILEMIPYRKDDWRYNSDHSRMDYLARRGYACCRLDVRGTGSSPGIALDEYTAAETQDGYDAVEWLAAQPWCNGRVGMWGISYGGFTAIQVAKLRPPHLKAIVPMYATDDRYLDDVHYLGGCKTASELAQYAVSMVAMNALPPSARSTDDWAARWKERLEQTPPWLLSWLRHQHDGAYWRQGSLRPGYEDITCAIFSIGGWADGYTNAALRMHEACVNAPRRTLIGNWSHLYPDTGYPGPNLDWLHEMVRFFDYWLHGIDNGVMDEPPLTLFRREYTEPAAFPPTFNGAWHSEAGYPIARTRCELYYLGAGTLEPEPAPTSSADPYPHRPTLGTHASLCWGAGGAPNGLSRDLRPDEALSLTYTGPPLSEPLDIIGFPEAVLHLSSSAPVAHVVVRLTDVAPDGTSAHVTSGVLNLTHRNGHDRPEPLTPGEVYPIRVILKAAGYRFLAGHRIRLSVASAWWPVIFPSPYPADNALHHGGLTPSRLILPVVGPDPDLPAPPRFKTTPPEMIAVGRDGQEDPPVWRISEDVIAGSVTVESYEGGETVLPDSTSLFASEHIRLTTFHDDPAHAQLYNEGVYRLTEAGYTIEVESVGTIRGSLSHFHVDIALRVRLNGSLFFQRSWLESIPRHLL